VVVRLQPILLSALFQGRRNLNFRGDEIVARLQPILLSALFKERRNLNFRGDSGVAKGAVGPRQNGNLPPPGNRSE